MMLDSGKGKKFTARPVEGVRVKAGDDARADLVIIEGRRLHGTVTDFAEEKPMADIWVQSYNSARPRSGSAQLGSTTDDSAKFELFVPPGSADVYCRGHYKHRTVVADRDPDFRLKGLPLDPFNLAVVKNGYTPGWATIPFDAHEIELTLSIRPEAPD
jgi:hypothetical protein